MCRAVVSRLPGSFRRNTFLFIAQNGVGRDWFRCGIRHGRRTLCAFLLWFRFMFRSGWLSGGRLWPDGFSGRLSGPLCSLEFLDLELQQGEEASGDLAIEGDFVAQEDLVDAHAVGGIFPGQDGAQRRIVGDGGRGHLVVEGDLLHSPDAPLTPAGGGDVSTRSFWVGVRVPQRGFRPVRGTRRFSRFPARCFP